jgi:hypothetical protein
MGFYETHRSFEIHLPEHPAATFEYPSTVLALVEVTGGADRRLALTGGSVALGGSNILSIKLQEQGRPFWANGNYPTTWFLLRPRQP